MSRQSDILVSEDTDNTCLQGENAVKSRQSDKARQSDSVVSVDTGTSCSQV